MPSLGMVDSLSFFLMGEVLADVEPGAVANGMVGMGPPPPMTLSMRLLEFVVGNGMAMFIQNLVGRTMLSRQVVIRLLPLRSVPMVWGWDWGKKEWVVMER